MTRGGVEAGMMRPYTFVSPDAYESEEEMLPRPASRGDGAGAAAEDYDVRGPG